MAADGICVRAQQRLAAIPQADGPPQLVASLAARLAVQRTMLADLTRAALPTPDRNEITSSLLAPFGEAILSQQRLLPAIQEAIVTHDEQRLAALFTDFTTASHPVSLRDAVKSTGAGCRAFEYFRTP